MAGFVSQTLFPLCAVDHVLPLWHYGSWRGSDEFQRRAMCPVPKDCMLESGEVAGSLSQPASGGCIHLPLMPRMVVGFLLAVSFSGEHSYHLWPPR